MQSVTNKSFMLSCVRLNVVMLSVVAPFQMIRQWASGGDSVVKQSTHYPKFEGSNPGTTSSGRKKVEKVGKIFNLKTRFGVSKIKYLEHSLKQVGSP